jgi:hypothetical protein
MRILRVSVIPDRQRSKVAGAARNRRAEDHGDQEKGEHGLDYEAGGGRNREGHGAQSGVVRECRCAEAGLRSPQYGPQQQRTDDTANELTDDVANRLAGAHRAGGEHADSDGGVHVPARHGAVGEGEKVPMNSARSLGAIRLDIVDSKDEIDSSARSGCVKGRYVGWGWLAARVGAASRRVYSAAMVCGLKLTLSAFATPAP